MRKRLGFSDPDIMGRRVPIRIMNADGTAATGEAGNAARMWTADDTTDAAIGNLVAANATYGLYYVVLSQAQTEHLPDTDGLLYYKGAGSITGHTELDFVPSRFKHRAAIAAATINTIDLTVSLTTIRPGDVVWILKGTGAPQAAVVKSHNATGGAGAKSRITLDADWNTTPDNTSVVAIEAGPLPATYLDARLRFMDRDGGDDATQSLAKMAESGTPFTVTGGATPSIIPTDAVGYPVNAFTGGAYLKFRTGALKELGRSIIESATDGTMTTEAFPVAPGIGDAGVIL